MSAARRPSAALREFLAAQGIEAASTRAGERPHSWHVTGQRWWPLELPGRAAPLHVCLPVQGDVRQTPDGGLQADFAPPDADMLAEAAAFANSLVAHGQVGARGSPRGGASHEIVVDPDGRERLVRRRFSAR
ncbi:MAG: hypothetical protein KF788_19370 [Piscinibacter sp.]|nr:hypothetical protein [Piscinibacter sp.]